MRVLYIIYLSIMIQEQIFDRMTYNIITFQRFWNFPFWISNKLLTPNIWALGQNLKLLDPYSFISIFLPNQIHPQQNVATFSDLSIVMCPTNNRINNVNFKLIIRILYHKILDRQKMFHWTGSSAKHMLWWRLCCNYLWLI